MSDLPCLGCDCPKCDRLTADLTAARVEREHLCRDRDNADAAWRVASETVQHAHHQLDDAEAGDGKRMRLAQRIGVLAAERDAAIRERDEAREQLAVERADCVKKIDRVDAVLARAEKAEQMAILAYLTARAAKLDGYTEQQSETEEIRDELRAGAHRKEAT